MSSQLKKKKQKEFKKRKSTTVSGATQAQNKTISQLKHILDQKTTCESDIYWFVAFLLLELGLLTKKLRNFDQVEYSMSSKDNITDRHNYMPKVF